MPYMGKTNDTSEGPGKRLLGSSLEELEHRILGDLGTQLCRWVIMAV
jgi:hypothetical protein